MCNTVDDLFIYISSILKFLFWQLKFHDLESLSPFIYSFIEYLPLFKSAIMICKKNHLYVKLVKTTTLPPGKQDINGDEFIKKCSFFYTLASARKKAEDLGVLMLFISCEMYRMI